MRELARSMASFSWAMSMFGVEQMTNLIAPRRAAVAFGAVSRTVEKELGPGLRSAFQTGDRLQRAVVDLSFGLVGLGTRPASARGAGGNGLLRQVGNLGFELLQAGVDTVYWVTGSVWQQEQGASGWGPIPPAPEPAPEK
ncbi:MAG TPA: hypothetical protein VKM72_36060 [Thermoanaerobaculia bacterium]|nr:hypothetical protein [Thermoanaerobaculia bacterium]